MFEFANPAWFLLLLVFLLGHFFLKLKEDALIFPHSQEIYVKKNYFILLIKWLGIICLISALATPVLKENLIKRKNPAHAIALVMDLSGSMRKYFDKDKTRFEVAKNMASNFIAKRSSDHVGIVVFAQGSCVISPLSWDTKSVAVMMESINLGIIGLEGTALYEGLFVSSQMLKNSNAKEKIAIILSDGLDEGSLISLDEALKFAKVHKIRAYTIGITNKQGVFGNFFSMPNTDYSDLKRIAKETNGKYFSANDTESLQKIYEQIDKLESSDLDSKPVFKTEHLYQWFLFFALILLMLHTYLKQKKAF